jgi:tRNA(Ile2) C34 agmatinyltransferase TiaS
MVDHNYRVRLTTQTVQHVVASTVQLHGDHLVFVNSKGQLTALFLKNFVRSWNMLSNILPDDTVLRCCSGTEPIP